MTAERRLRGVRRLLLVVSVLAVCMTACSDGDATVPSPTTLSPDPTSTPVSPSDLRGKLLTTSDLPDGFSQVTIGERDPTRPTAGAPDRGFCTEIDQHRRGYPGERVAEVDFERVKGTTRILVNEEITRYATVNDATLSFADLQKALEQCASVTKNDGDNALVGSFAPVTFAKEGDDLRAYAFNATQFVEEDSATISGYFVTLRVGRHVVLFSAVGSVDSLPQRDVEQINKRVVARI